MYWYVGFNHSSQCVTTILFCIVLKPRMRTSNMTHAAYADLSASKMWGSIYITWSLWTKHVYDTCNMICDISIYSQTSTIYDFRTIYIYIRRTHTHIHIYIYIQTWVTWFGLIGDLAFPMGNPPFGGFVEPLRESPTTWYILGYARVD